MIRIAILGDIGSGKSYISKLFNYSVFNADVEVGKLYRRNRKCYKKLKKVLPSYINSFPVKKNQLFKAIKTNHNNLKKINKIIHPEVRKKMNFFLEKNKNKKFVVLDIPLFLENKLNKKNDILIYVDSKKKDIYRKLRKRRNFNPKIVSKLRKLQLPLERKKNKSHFILKNNFKNKSVKKNVRMIKEKILLNA